MGKIILITGGARSGKSTFAESLAKDIGSNILYIATSLPIDDEMRTRIKKHQENRPNCWMTIEQYKNLDEIIINNPSFSGILIDCVTIMVTNLLMDIDTDWDSTPSQQIDRFEEAIFHEFNKIIKASTQIATPIIIVTNEIGMGIVPDNHLSRVFRDIAGRVNQIIAKHATDVYLCVSGIPVRIKG
jgi:adenosylcobinamide kinase/adenosylcobinamide-phosphate guanylyltransferase